MAFITATSGQKCREVYIANNTTDLPGTIICREGDPASGDIAVDEAYDGAGATYDFYKELFDRNSIDDNGMCMLSSVHSDLNYANAFWDGKQMVYWRW